MRRRPLASIPSTAVPALLLISASALAASPAAAAFDLPPTTLLPPPVLLQAAIGALSGATGAVASYPLDFVKAQLQTDDGRSRYSDGIDAAARIVAEDGPLGLYKGAEVSILGYMPESGAAFAANQAARSFLLGGSGVAVAGAAVGLPPYLAELLAGGLAGLAQVVVTNPIEVIKVGRQTSDLSTRQLYDAIGGFRGLYRGSGACAVRDVTFSAVLFCSYPHVRDGLAGWLGDGGQQVGLAEKVLAGCLSAMPAGFLATPADVVKTRMQQATGGKIGEGRIGESMNFFEAAAELMAEEEEAGRNGPAVLLSGWLERVIRFIPQYGVSLAMFDVLSDAAVERGLLVQSAVQ